MADISRMLLTSLPDRDLQQPVPAPAARAATLQKSVAPAVRVQRISLTRPASSFPPAAAPPRQPSPAPRPAARPAAASEASPYARKRFPSMAPQPAAGLASRAARGAVQSKAPVRLPSMAPQPAVRPDAAASRISQVTCQAPTLASQPCREPAGGASTEQPPAAKPAPRLRVRVGDLVFQTSARKPQQPVHEQASAAEPAAQPAAPAFAGPEQPPAAHELLQPSSPVAAPQAPKAVPASTPPGLLADGGIDASPFRQLLDTFFPEPPPPPPALQARLTAAVLGCSLNGNPAAHCAWLHHP